MTLVNILTHASSIEHYRRAGNGASSEVCTRTESKALPRKEQHRNSNEVQTEAHLLDPPDSAESLQVDA